ncbi:putative transposase-like protein (plasmid) [Rhizobium johnstonii 3841]|uniref:Transposase-like protein n=1 Tax=Rhizobium johnstonii (strain DSM 114642 / LMG 32736 / 3841) TaxID=216596 RepID=Q1M9Y6_RHIJ3|nr:putative transposase-like protein [Rhizobium johnstonii 3841]
MHALVDSTGLQVYGAGQWLEEKHGARSRRGWRKLHLALEADSGEIVAHTLTDQDAGDVSQVAPLLDQIGGPIGQFTADGVNRPKPAHWRLAPPQCPARRRRCRAQQQRHHVQPVTSHARKAAPDRRPQGPQEDPQ